MATISNDGEIPVLHRKEKAVKKKAALTGEQLDSLIQIADSQLAEIKKLSSTLIKIPLLGDSPFAPAKNPSAPSGPEDITPEESPAEKSRREKEEKEKEKETAREQKRKERERKVFEHFSTSVDSAGEIFSKNLFAPAGYLNNSIASLTGIDIGKSITDKFKGLFDPDKKSDDRNKKLDRNRGDGLFGTGKAWRKPITRALISKVDPGAVLIADALKKGGGGLPEGAEGEGGDLLGGLFGKGGGAGLLKGLLPMIVKGGGILSLAAGLIWGTIDAILAVGKADKWGTSKISAGIAGFFAGPGEGGMKDAFKNAGKWALIGIGVGTLIAPGVGTLVGGLIGAALGGILGFFGGKKIAQGLDKLGDWFKKNVWESEIVVKIREFVVNIGTTIWSYIKSPFEGLFNAIEGFDFSKFGDIWSDPDKSLGEKLGETLAEVWHLAVTAVGGWFTGIVKGLVGLFEDTFVGRDGKKSLVESGFDMVKEVGKGAVDFFGSLFTSLGKLIVESSPFKAVVGFLDTYVVKPIAKFFNQIGDFFAYIGSMNILDMIKVVASGNFGTKLADYSGAREMARLRESGELKKWAEEKGTFYNRAGGLELQRAAISYAAQNGIELPKDFDIFKKYHTGGLAPYEQTAILRKDERVLSPYQTRMYDDLNTRADLALRQTIASSQEKMQEIQLQTTNVLTKAVERLAKIMEGREGTSLSNQNVTQNFVSPFRGSVLLNSLTLEVD